MPAQNVKAIVKRYFTEFPEDNSNRKKSEISNLQSNSGLKMFQL